MKRVQRKLLVIAAGSFLLLIGYLTITYMTVSAGRRVDLRLRSSQPRDALREAQQSWANGNYARSVPQFAQAAFMIVDSNVRWKLADIYIDKAKVQFDEGDGHSAFKSCRSASRMLGYYDGRLMIDEACWLRFAQERFGSASADPSR